MGAMSDPSWKSNSAVALSASLGRRLKKNEQNRPRLTEFMRIYIFFCSYITDPLCMRCRIFEKNREIRLRRFDLKGEYFNISGKPAFIMDAEPRCQLFLLNFTNRNMVYYGMKLTVISTIFVKFEMNPFRVKSEKLILRIKNYVFIILG